MKSSEDVENGAYFLWYFLLVGVNVRAGSYKYQLDSKIKNFYHPSPEFLSLFLSAEKFNPLPQGARVVTFLINFNCNNFLTI